MATIVVADDQVRVLRSFEKMLKALGHDVLCAENGEDAVALVESKAPDLLVMDIHMPGISGLDALAQVQEHEPDLPVIIMTAFGTTETAIEATKKGAFEYLVKPFDPEEMLSTIDRALECQRLMTRSVEPSSAAVVDADTMIGDSPLMQDVYKAIGRVAPTDAAVLIRGETGTGKELVAKAIYNHSKRSVKPFVMVNCAAIPENLLESELLGHEKGAFTGAHQQRQGKFELADGGTIFLDEIGDMPLSVQAKILRVLQEQCFERVGGNELIRVDVRVFAATNQNLEQAIEDGEFREDLYHRLNVWTITVPPLRQRAEDVPKLVKAFISRFAERNDIKPPVVSEAAMQTLKAHDWPGNVRELEHCINRALIYTSGYPIREEDVRHVLKSGATVESAESLRDRQSRLEGLIKEYLAVESGDGTQQYLMDLVDKLLAAEALRCTEGNRTQAAKILGISRPTMQAKIRKYQLEIGPPKIDVAGSD